MIPFRTLAKRSTPVMSEWELNQIMPNPDIGMVQNVNSNKAYSEIFNSRDTTLINAVTCQHGLIPIKLTGTHCLIKEKTPTYVSAGSEFGPIQARYTNGVYSERQFYYIIFDRPITAPSARQNQLWVTATVGPVNTGILTIRVFSTKPDFSKPFNWTNLNSISGTTVATKFMSNRETDKRAESMLTGVYYATMNSLLWGFKMSIVTQNNDNLLHDCDYVKITSAYWVMNQYENRTY